MSRGCLSRTVDQCGEILNALETEECRLKFDVASLQNILTAKDLSPAGSNNEDEPSQADYSAAPIVVETKGKTFTYKNIDDLLGRVVTEESLVETCGTDSDGDVFAPTSKLVDVLRKGVNHKFIENKQLVGSYTRDCTRHKSRTPESDPANVFLSQLDVANDEDLLTLAKRDSRLAEALPKYVLAVRRSDEVNVTSKGSTDFNCQRDAIQVALNEALLTDIAGVSLTSSGQSELLQLASVVQASVDFEKLKKLVCVKMDDTS